MFFVFFFTFFFLFFFFNDTATTEIYTLSLHDALPISPPPRATRSPSFRTPGPRRRSWRRGRSGFARAGRDCAPRSPRVNTRRAGDGDLPQHPGRVDPRRRAHGIRAVHRLRPALPVLRYRVRVLRRPADVPGGDPRGGGEVPGEVRLSDRGGAHAAEGPAAARAGAARPWLPGLARDAWAAAPRGGAAGRAQDRGPEDSGIGRTAYRVQRLQRACARRRGEGRGLLSRRLPVGAAEARRAPGLGKGPRSLLPVV